jgi:Domain of unknown function (DUF4407)
VKRLLIWLSGARPEILALCPTDSGKYAGIGSAVLITATMATVSMVFALHTALMVALPIAIGTGMAWGLAIMSLDRWLVVSIQRHEKSRQNFYPAIPRLVLALLFGIVISTPLVLQIFKPEIEAQMVVIQQKQSDAFTGQQQHGDLGKQIGTLQRQQTTEQNIITSGGDLPVDPNTDPKIIGLTKQRDDQQKVTDAAYKEWQCQLYGPCKPQGPGPLANADQTAYQTDKARLDGLNSQIDARKTELNANDQQGKARKVADARASLTEINSQLATLTAQRDLLQKENSAKSKADTGLLMRLTALDQVGSKDATLYWAQLLLFLFITAIECLPIFVKLLSTFGEESNYEKILKMKERSQVRMAAERIKQIQRETLRGGDQILDEIWNDGPGAEPGRSPVPAAPTRPDARVGDDLGADLDIGSAEPGPPPAAEPMPDLWEDQRLRSLRDERVGRTNGAARPYQGSSTEPASEHDLVLDDDEDFV